MYLQPPVLAMFALIAGVAGSRIWSAAPKLDLVFPSASKLSSIRLAEDSGLDTSRPTLWLRVLGGAIIMFLGVAIADEFRSNLQKYSAGMLRVRSLGQGEFITWQIAAFAVLLGGMAAGAGTGAGTRHGLLAGLLGGVGIYGMCVKAGGALPPIQWWLVRLSLDELPLMTPSVVVGIAGSVFLAALAGGWLGGALFVPLAQNSLGKRLHDD